MKKIFLWLLLVGVSLTSLSQPTQTSKKKFDWWSVSSVAGPIYNAHVARVAADGGVIENPTLLRSTITSLVRDYSISSVGEFNSQLPVVLYPSIFGYKKGTGVGATLGFACTKLYSINSSNDAVQATAANQPLILIYGSEKYYFASRVSGDVISTPVAAFTFTVATDVLQVTAKIFGGTVVATNETIAQLGSFCNLRYNNNGAGTYSINWRGTANATASSNYTPSTTQPHWVRWVINEAADATAYFWSSDGINWTAIGTTTTPTVGTVGTLQIGTGTSATGTTKIYEVEYKNNTTAQVTTMDCDQYVRSTSETSWIGGGATWTIAMNSATTGLKGVVVDKTILMGNGTTHKMSIASITLNQPNTNYVFMRRLGTGNISGRAASATMSHDATNISINNGSALTLSNTGKLRQLVTAVYNGTTSQLQINNGTITSGAAGSNNGTYLDILANASSYGNFINEGYIISSSVDTESLRTKIYNLFFLAESDPEYDSPVYTWGEELLINWQSKVSSLVAGTPGTVLNMAFYGDSWVDVPYRFAGPILTWAKSLYGNAGGGFTGAQSVSPYTGTSVSNTGTWVNNYDKDNGIGVNKQHMNSTVTTSKIIFSPTDAFTTSYDLIYVKGLNRGTFSWKIGAGAKTNVATANATTDIGILTIPGTADLTIEVEVAGSAGVGIIGAIFKNTTNGIRGHKIAMSGINGVEMGNGDDSYYGPQFVAIAPDIVFILTTTNDMNGNVSPTASAAALLDRANSVRVVYPNCDIVIFPTGPNGFVGKTYTQDDYARAFYDMCKANNFTFLNLARLLGNYFYANLNGYMEDTAHVDADGGLVFANATIDILD